MLNWFAGRGNYGLFMDWVFGVCGTDWRLRTVAANGQPGFAAFVRAGGRYEPHTLQVFTVTAGGISRNSVFQVPRSSRRSAWQPDSTRSCGQAGGAEVCRRMSRGGRTVSDDVLCSCSSAAKARSRALLARAGASWAMVVSATVDKLAIWLLS